MKDGSGTPEPTDTSRTSALGGPPSPSGPGRGARAFRKRQEEKRSELLDRAGVVIVLVILALGVIAIVTAQPYSPTGSALFPKPGPTITVQLGAAGSGSVTCGNGATGYLDRVPFLGSTQPITTGDVNLRVYEVWDGDNIPALGVVANVSPTSMCAGSPPAVGPSTLDWYVVLTSPNGTILLSYTVAAGWTAIGSGSSNIVFPTGSELTVVTGTTIASTGRGLAVLGFAKGSPIQGSVTL